MRTPRTSSSALRPFLLRACAFVMIGMAALAHPAVASDLEKQQHAVEVSAVPSFADDFVLRPIPEPSTWLTLASGIGGLIGLQRFRRKSR